MNFIKRERHQHIHIIVVNFLFLEAEKIGAGVIDCENSPNAVFLGCNINKSIFLSINTYFG